MLFERPEALVENVGISARWASIAIARLAIANTTFLDRREAAQMPSCTPALANLNDQDHDSGSWKN